MKYSINREQQFFFDQNGYIEFDGLLTEKEQKTLSDALKKVASPTRDLSLDLELVKSVSHLPRLAALASSLTRVRLLRFAFDELLVAPFTITTLEGSIAVQGIACGLILSLEADHALYVNKITDFSTLPLDPSKRYFLIGYAEDKALYTYQPKDPFTHELKKRGYVFGDHLKAPLHPTLAR